MGINRDTIVVTFSALLITVLFHKQALGLNLLIFEAYLFLWVFMTKKLRLSGLNRITISLGLLITALFTVVTHSTFSYSVNFLVVTVFVGLLIYPDAKSLITALGLSFANIFKSQRRFLKQLSGAEFKDHKPGSYLWKFRIFFIPAVIISIFILIYSKSNPVFDELVGEIVGFARDKFLLIFNNFDLSIIFTFLTGLFVSVFIFIHTLNQRLIQWDVKADDALKRDREKGDKSFQITSLKNEYKAGVFLLVVLNLIILILNVIDINWVWFNFEWEGQYLKQFVHEGTYLLILSILISIVLVLYYFRRNLNFYPNNKLLKYLSFIWLGQNAILAISVAIRNFWYINYFALAYKRIGVIIFLILTIYGLFTVFRKVQNRKSAFYLFKINAYALLVVLVISSLINWDSIIAKHNFKHSNTSFLHLDYLATLSDKSLPYLDKTLPELKQIEAVQNEKFPFEQKFMTSEEYYGIIQNRKKRFIDKWEAKSILSWNLPEYLAYKKLLSEPDS